MSLDVTLYRHSYSPAWRSHRLYLNGAERSSAVVAFVKYGTCAARRQAMKILHLRSP